MSEQTEKLISVEEVLRLMQEEGYTRTPKTVGYQGNGKSIQEKYNLKNWELQALFREERLRNRRTIAPKVLSFRIIRNDSELPGQTALDFQQNEITDTISENNVSEQNN
jgi:hypothetical protein